MDYVINWGWLVALIFIPFLLGLVAGIKYTQQKITLKLLKKMSIDEFKKLMDE